MAGGAATHGGKARHLAGIQCRGLGRCQLFGNQDGMVGQLLCAVRHSEHQLEHPLADVFKVQRTLGQQAAAQPLEQLRGCLRGALPGEGCALALLDKLKRLLQQARVFQ